MPISRGQAEAVIEAAWGHHYEVREDGYVYTSITARRAIEAAFGQKNVPRDIDYQRCRVRWAKILRELARAMEEGIP